MTGNIGNIKKHPPMFPATAADEMAGNMETRKHPSLEGVSMFPVAGLGTASLVAIDIGRSGSLALFSVDGTLADIADMPILEDGPAARPTVNAPLLAAIIKRWAPAQATCEHVGARPGEAPAGSFAFGRARGVVEGVLAAKGIPVRFVTPAWWKRRAGIPAGREQKDTARSKAIACWPAQAEWFARKLDHDRAEAALLDLAFLNEGMTR